MLYFTYDYWTPSVGGPLALENPTDVGGIRRLRVPTTRFRCSYSFIM
jgi:hypothetical protein